MNAKRISGLIILIFIISIGAGQLQAQDEREVEERIAKAEKELQMKQELMEKNMHMREKEMQMKMEKAEKERKMRELEMEFFDQERIIAIQEDAMNSVNVLPFTELEELPHVFISGKQGSQTQLSIRNTFRGGSDSSKGEFEVNEDIRFFRCMITGRVRSGDIKVKVLYPGGKVFKELTLNSSAEVTFNQSLRIKEEENSKYVGSWTYEVVAEKAEGNYTLQISTN